MPFRPKKIADLPDSLPIFPVSGALLFPRLQSPLQIFEDRYIALVDHVLGSNRLIGLVQPDTANMTSEDGTTPESPPEKDAPIHHIGSIGYLAHFEEMADHRYLIGLEGICRFRVTREITTDTPFRRVEFSAQDFQSDFDENAQAGAIDRTNFIEVMKSYVEFMEIDVDWEEIERTDTADLINLGCMLSPHGPREKQLLLEAHSLQDRADTLIALVEMQMAQANSAINLQ